MEFVRKRILWGEKQQDRANVVNGNTAARAACGDPIGMIHTSSHKVLRSHARSITVLTILVGAVTSLIVGTSEGALIGASQISTPGRQSNRTA